MNSNKKLTERLRSLLLATLLLGSAAQGEVRPLDRIVAIIDNDVVMQTQLDRRLREVEQTIAKRGAQLPPRDQLVSQVLERLILESIQLQMGSRAGIRIGDEELAQAMATIAQRNGLTLEQFQAALARDGLSFDEAREQVRREMIISRVRQRVVADRIQISDHEVQNFLASDLGKLQLSEEFRLANITIPLPDGAPPEQIQAAEQQVLEIYRQLSDGADFAQLAITRSAGETALEGGEIGWRRAAQLPPPFDNLVSQLPVGGVTEPVRTPGGYIIIKLLEKRGGSAQIRDEVHVRHILIKPSEIRTDIDARRLIERIHERILNGEDFAELAKSFSEDPGSALNGGDLNWIDPNALVPEFREMMAKTPAGELSPPFKSPFGWHVLEVLGRRATDSSTQVREQQAMNVLRNRKYDEELQSWLRQIRDEAYVETKL
ncbi:Peptidyl-prolyl cis-trans isomerase SurA [Azotobacter vinelandii CA]|uniref:Chaperone SurA n=2 Tax=Azotobacter vinelandii TaxID=354 RepID=C1DIW7_AZOVD|nr:peptidylprolyl isomerase [Azotobacter vinelandii]ACO80786.1 Peptidyl-prolyl cis-trans isomerase SurA [Azotobacter vinelandii DJ]AGK14278.1 Peptidyl-prolyl cis-trans isomerase SurA [Azotobacter vinelandii CA]AGK22158.1 Peptidyl-prolyl cis-trans isomerase SurA [Azotobacter vinelandii CA6]SFX03475.1 periplasmic chaperone for outer membrane proteins SurA [Azotobacter vinelandii]GLK60737.1 chaperone SurA [Azotobacter vinelandii]